MILSRMGTECKTRYRVVACFFSWFEMFSFYINLLLLINPLSLTHSLPGLSTEISVFLSFWLNVSFVTDTTLFYLGHLSTKNWTCLYLFLFLSVQRVWGCRSYNRLDTFIHFSVVLYLLSLRYFTCNPSTWAVECVRISVIPLRALYRNLFGNERTPVFFTTIQFVHWRNDRRERLNHHYCCLYTEETPLYGRHFKLKLSSLG